MKISKIILYDEPSVSKLDLKNIQKFIREKFGINSEIRENIFKKLNEKKQQIRDSNKRNMQNKRSIMSDDEKETAKVEDKKNKRFKRSLMTPEEIKTLNETNASGMRKARAEKLQSDPNYRETMVSYMAKYRKDKFTRLNKTVVGRKKIFYNSVKYGPIFGIYLQPDIIETKEQFEQLLLGNKTPEEIAFSESETDEMTFGGDSVKIKMNDGMMLRFR